MRADAVANVTQAEWDSALSIITEVRLERFKAAFKPEPIPLRPFNVLIGRNGSGKSTLVEALQWIDTAMRRDAREACVRYWGIHDLINLRGWTKKPFFQLTVTWDGPAAQSLGTKTQYSVKVEESDSTPLIAAERPARRAAWEAIFAAFARGVAHAVKRSSFGRARYKTRIIHEEPRNTERHEIEES